jgi:hypothetical protein
MKQLIFFCFVAISLLGQAQSNDTTKYSPVSQYGYQWKRGRVDSIFILPTGDTSSKSPRQVKIIANDLWWTTNNGQWKSGKSSVSASSPLSYNNSTGVFTLTQDSSPTAGSPNPVQSGGVYTALAGKYGPSDSVYTISTKANVTKIRDSLLAASNTWNATTNIFKALSINGTSGNGYINLKAQSSVPPTPSNGFNLYANNNNRFGWVNTLGYSHSVIFPLNSNDSARMPYVIGAVLADSNQVATNYAKIASPTLTGVPLSPTPSLADSSNQITTSAGLKQLTATMKYYFDPTTFTGDGSSTSPIALSLNPIPVYAAPIAKVGKTAVSGTSGYYMASNAAPALDATQNYNFTGKDTLGGSVTATNNALTINPYDSATNNSQVLAPVLITPTFANGAFTGVIHSPLQIVWDATSKLVLSNASAVGATLFHTSQSPSTTNYFLSADGSTTRLNGQSSSAIVSLRINNSEYARLFSTGRLYLGASATDDGVNQLQVNGSTVATQYRISALNTAPSTSTSTGTLGEIRITAGYIYVCTATNTWVRAALVTF